MIVNSLTSGFMHGGEPVAGGLLVVYESKEHRRTVDLYLDGEIYNYNPVTLNQNGRILQPLEAKEESVYCEVLNNAGNFLFGFELRGTAALLPFVPNSLNSKSTGVTDGGSIVIKNAASLNLEANAAINMTGEAKIKMIEGSQINLGSHAKLLAMGAGAISGLQGLISSSNVLEEYARAYSLTGTISLNEEISAEAKDSFLEGDVFYFIAEENKIDVNYFGTNGEPQKDTLNKGEALSLILAGKNDGKLLFRKLTSTGDVENLKEHVGNLKEHVGNSKNDITKLQDAVRELQPTGTDNQVMLGSGKKTPDVRDAASSLFTTAIENSQDALFLYGQTTEGRACKMKWGDFMQIVISELVNGNVIPEPPNITEIDSVSISIDPPVNGAELSLEVTVNDSEYDIRASEIDWAPNPFDIANLTQTYTATITLRAHSESIESAFRFARDAQVMVNSEILAPENVFSESSWVLRVTKVFPKTMNTLSIPRLSIPNPVLGNSKPQSAAQDDEDAANYSNSISWEPNTPNFEAGQSTGTFTLEAESGFRWNAAQGNAAQAWLNDVEQENVQLSPDGMMLTFAKTVNLSAPPPPPPPPPPNLFALTLKLTLNNVISPNELGGLWASYVSSDHASDTYSINAEANIYFQGKTYTFVGWSHSSASGYTFVISQSPDRGRYQMIKIPSNTTSTAKYIS